MERIVVAESWVPSWAPSYIKATYTPLILDPSTGLVDEAQRIECKCEACGAEWKQPCTTGAARVHIQRFTKEHLECGGPR